MFSLSVQILKIGLWSCEDVAICEIGLSKFGSPSVDDKITGDNEGISSLFQVLTLAFLVERYIYKPVPTGGAERN
jgi:hypothetical protein